MITFPNCKINLGLHIVARRPDGYHDIETVFLPVNWSDVLEAVKTEGTNSGAELRTTGIRLFGPKEKNLCVRAYELLATKHPLPPVRMHLHKLVPIGAGLGGGSADAASTLVLLNKMFRLDLKDEELEAYASQLGSDCAFFIRNKPVFASGRGDRFEPISVKLKNHFLVIVKPRVHISTAEAYAGVKPAKPRFPIREVLRLPVEEWSDKLVNDFEATVFAAHPGVANIKKKLYKLGAVYASMSGSGSSVYGIFREEKNLKAYFRSCTVWQGPVTTS